MRQKLPSLVVYIIWMAAVGIIILAALSQNGDTTLAANRTPDFPIPLNWIVVGAPLVIIFLIGLFLWRSRSTTVSGASEMSLDGPPAKRIAPTHVIAYLLFFLAVAVIIIASLIRQ
jgi:hypothetical protein